MLKRLIYYFALFAALSFIGACYNGAGHMCPQEFGDGNLGPNDNSSSDGGGDEAYGQRSAIGVLITGNVNQKVSLQCAFSNAKARTLYFNLQLADVFTGVVTPPQAEALIEFMVNGNTVIRRISINNGTSITGMAEAVRVVISDTSQTGGINLGKLYNVSVSVADGARPSGSVPPTLSPNAFASPSVFSMGPGGGRDYILPLDAGINCVAIMAVDDSGGVLTDGIILVNHFSTTISLRAYDPRQFEWAPVSGGTIRINIVNKSTTQTALIQLIYGIDG